MNKQLYKRDLVEARNKLADMLKQRDLLDIEIARLRSDIAALSQLAGESVSCLLKDMGLTEACREVLRAVTQDLTPVEARSYLKKMGYDTESYTNLTASIHTTFRRMALSGEAEENISTDGRKAYRLKHKVSHHEIASL
jgi:hypothetical protein